VDNVLSRPPATDDDASSDKPEERLLRRAGPGVPLNSASRWYVVQTHGRAELRASQHLRRQGFDTYLPRYIKQRRHARRIEKVAAPLFPRYVFVGIDMTTQRWRAIQSTVGVTRLVTNGDVPAAVPQGVVEGLQRREDANGFLRLDQRPRFVPGDKVRIAQGTFCDCLGLFEGLSGKERSAILLDLLGRKVRVVIDTEFIDAA